TIDLATAERTQFTVTRRGLLSPLLSPDGHSLAFGSGGPDTTAITLLMQGGATARLYVANPPPGELAPGPNGVPNPWPERWIDTHSYMTQPFGWIDNAHLMIGVWTSSRFQAMARERIALLNVDTGAMTPVISLEGKTNFQPDPAFAAN